MDKPPKGWRYKVHSFSKMIVWFQDGNVRTFYSLDWKSKYSRHRDRTIGFKRFESLMDKYGRKARMVEVYDLTSGEVIFRYHEGKRQDGKNLKDKPLKS